MENGTIVLGAGLTGLLLAYRLKSAGRKVRLLEARNRIGGRIYTRESHQDTPVEMGATWFGKKHLHLVAALEEFGIGEFEQQIEGISFFEPFSTSPPQAVQFPASEPSYRLAGGTSKLTTHLAEQFTESELLLGQVVQKLDFTGETVAVTTTSGEFKADQIISTVPPALFVHSILCTPALPTALVSVAQATQTWMAESIKTALVYDQPFWKPKQWSGMVYSNAGPLNELYDHNNVEETRFALCGFVNGGFAELPASNRKTRVNQQLERIFGQSGLEYAAYEEVVWAKEAFTKVPQEPTMYPHQNNGHAVYQESWFGGRLMLAGTETSSEHGGYLDGAINSANTTAAKALATAV